MEEVEDVADTKVGDVLANKDAQAVRVSQLLVEKELLKCLAKRT